MAAEVATEVPSHGTLAVQDNDNEVPNSVRALELRSTSHASSYPDAGGCRRIVSRIVVLTAVIGLFAVLGIVLLGFNTIEAIPAASPGCGSSPPLRLKKGVVQDGWTVEFRDPWYAKPKRDYALYVPSYYDPEKPMPLVLDFHGFYSSDMYIAKHDGVSLAAEAQGFIVAYPDGTKDFKDGLWWNNWNGGGTNATGPGKYGDTCLPDHSLYPCYNSCAKAGLCTKGTNRHDCGCSGCSDDVGFVAELLSTLKNSFCIDESRVHGTGMSTGALFLYYLATTTVGAQLASIAPTAGSFLLGFLDVPKVPMPVLDIHGTKDDTIPSNASNSYGKYKKTGCPVQNVSSDKCSVSDDSFFYHVTSDILSAWASVNKCPPGGKPTRVPTHHDGKTGWTCMLPHGRGCEAQVQFCTHNLGHTWPFHEGQGKVRTREYGEAIWEFMHDKRRNLTTGMPWLGHAPKPKVREYIFPYGFW